MIKKTYENPRIKSFCYSCCFLTLPSTNTHFPKILSVWQARSAQAEMGRLHRPEGESGALRGSPCWPEVFYFGCLISCWNGIITGSQRGRAGFGRHTFLSAILGNVERLVCLFIYFVIFEDLDTSNFYYTSTFFKFVLLLSIILLYQCLYRYSLHCQKRHLFLFFFWMEYNVKGACISNSVITYLQGLNR